METKKKLKKPITENQRFYVNKLYNFLRKRDYTTKDEMFEFLGWNKTKDRQLRDLLSLIGQKVPLISVSSDRGYKIAKDESDLELVEHTWAELSSRTEILMERIKPLVKFRDKYKYGIGEN